MNLKDIVSSLDTRYERRVQGPTRGRCIGIDFTNKLAEIRLDSSFDQSSTVKVSWVNSPPIPGYDCKIHWDNVGNPIVIGALQSSYVNLIAGNYTNLALSSGTTTSSSFADFPGTVSFSGTKNYESTFLIFRYFASCYSTAVNTAVTMSCELDSGSTTDYTIGSFYFNTASQHHSFSSFYKQSGISSGTYTFTLRWKRSSGAGTLTTDSNDSAGLEVIEYYPIA